MFAIVGMMASLATYPPADMLIDAGCVVAFIGQLTVPPRNVVKKKRKRHHPINVHNVYQQHLLLVGKCNLCISCIPFPCVFQTYHLPPVSTVVVRTCILKLYVHVYSSCTYMCNQVVYIYLYIATVVMHYIYKNSIMYACSLHACTQFKH